MSESKRVLTKKDITNLAIRSSLLQAGFSYERMQAAGWLYAQLPVLEKIYKDDKAGLSAAMVDNMEFINTHPNLVGFLMGLLVSLEEQHENRDTIKGLKLALLVLSPVLVMRFSGLHYYQLSLVSHVPLLHKD